MTRTFYLILLLLGLILACNSNEHKKLNSTSRLVPEPDIAERLHFQKASIDTLFNTNRNNIEILVKMTDRSDLVRFKDSILPDEAETSFYVLRDSLNQIIAITESPYSRSGDWFLTLTHYFDKSGQTFAFERQLNFFNSGCTEGVAYETKTEYYSNEFELVRKQYNLVDQKGNILNKDSCSSMYDFEYTVLPDLNKSLQAHGINGR